MQACRAGPPNPAICPQGRGLKPGSYVVPFQTPRKLVLAVVMAASLDSGTPGGDSSGLARSPLREGTAGERGIWAIGVSEMTDADIVWPLIRGSHTMRWARAVSLSCFQCCKWASHPTIQTDPASYLEERGCGVQDWDLGRVWGQVQPVTQPTPGPWSPQGSGVGVLLVPSDEAQLTGPGVGAGSAPSSAP